MPRTASKAGGFKVRTGKAGFKEEEHPRGRAGLFRDKPGEGKERLGERRVAVAQKPRRPGGAAGSVGAAPEPTPTARTKSEIAKLTSKKTDGPVQRYAEEHNEAHLSKGLSRNGRVSQAPPDNEPHDAEIRFGGKVTAFVELKTMVDNDGNRIWMKASATQRKKELMLEHGVHFNTVVFDHQQIYNAHGPGQHGDPADAPIYFRRGWGNFRVEANMHRVKDLDELARLQELPTDQLPAKARPPRSYPGL